MARASRKLWIVLAVACALGAGFALGPRPRVDDDVRGPRVPDVLGALDSYVGAAEAKYDDIRPGAEKAIVWADPAARAQTELAIVYLHGFSATRQEIAPVCERLGRALGANVFFTRLRGHGRTADAMAEPTVDDWLRDGLEALAIGQRLGRRVVVVGTSTGATLATWLASRPEAQGVHAFVLVSPNFGLHDSRARILLWPWGTHIARLIQGAYRSFEPLNERQARAWTTRYRTDALVTLMALVRLVEELDLSRLTQPFLLVYSQQDRVVDPAATAQAYEALGARVKQRLVIDDSEDPSHHVIAGDIVSPATTDEVVGAIGDFLARL